MKFKPNLVFDMLMSNLRWIALFTGLFLLLFLPFFHSQLVKAQTKDTAISQRLEVKSNNGLESLHIFNVAISVPNVDETINWYEDKLGFKLQNRRKVSTGIEIALIEKNGFYIDIIRIANSKNVEGSPQNPPNHLLVQGLRNLVFWVDDLKATDAQLKSKGVKLIWESRYIPEIETSVTNFRDNNGNLIAIWEKRYSNPK